MKKKWVKLVLASSIDGRIAYPEGGKTQLGQSGDRLVLEESLAWSDGILMGGQTLRDHQSICLIKNKSLLKKRLFSTLSLWSPSTKVFTLVPKVLPLVTNNQGPPRHRRT